MNTEFLSKFYDPFPDILMLKYDQNIKNQINNPSLRIIIDSLDFTPISQKECNQIKNKLKNGELYSSCLANINTNVQFIPSFLQALPEIKTLLAPEFDFYCKFILESYAGWCISQEKTKAPKHILILMRALIKIVNSKYSELVQSAFIKIMAYISTIQNSSLIVDISEIIVSFFETSCNILLSAYEAYKILLKTVIEEAQGSVNEGVTAMFISTTKIIDLHGKGVDYCFVKSVVDVIAPYLYSLDPQSILFFSSAFEFLKDSEKELYSLLISKLVIEMVMAKPKLESLDLQENTPLLVLERSKYSLDINTGFKDVTTFENGLNLTKNYISTENDEIIKFIDVECHEKIKAISLFLQKNKSEGIKFLNNLKSKIKNDFRVMAVFIYLAQEASKTIEIPNYSNFFISSDLFKPTITCLEENKETTDLSSFRQAAIHIIVDSGSDPYRDMLDMIVTKPYLFNEILNRCTSLIPKIAQHFVNNAGLLHTFVKEMTFLQNADFDGIKEVEEVRLRMLVFLSSLFGEPNVQEVFFGDALFLETYLSFLFEDPLRKLVLDTLKSYLTSEKVSITTILSVAISNVTEIVRMTLPDEKSIQLDNDLIVVLADVLSHRHSLGQMTLLTCSSLCLSLSLIEKSELSTEFLLNCMRLFAHSSHIFTMKDEQRKTLAAAIETVFGDTPPMTVFNRLMQIISGNNINFMSTNFMIRQPKILQVLLYCYERSTEIFKVLETINNLLDYSQSNIIACRAGDVDSYILNILLANWYKEDAFTNEFIDICFTILRKISAVTSSITVARKFEALLCPMESEFLPDNFSKVLTTLNTIVALSLNSPQSFLPMDEKNVFKPEGKLSMMPGFWFVFWFNANAASAHYNPILLTATNEKGHKLFQVQLINNCITITQRSKKATSSSRIDYEISTNEWTFFAMKYLLAKDTSTIIPYVNSTDLPSIVLPAPSSSEAYLSFGGVDDEIPEGTSMTLMGGFAVFKDPSTERIFRLNEHGPLQLNRELTDYFYKFTPEITPENTLPNLGTVLSEKCELLAILPVFSVLPMKMRNGTSCLPCIDQVIELISNILLINETTEREFAEANGFSIIANLLLSYPKETINYQSYRHFFSLIQMLRTHRLQRCLLNDILANINIWIVSDKDSFERIISHWARDLFPSVKIIPSLPISFEDLLNMYILYFWDDDGERDRYIQGAEGSVRQRSEGINIEKCRKNMCEVLLTMSTVKFTDDDFEILISHIMRCKDKRQAEWLVTLLRQMTMVTPTPLLGLTKIEEAIPKVLGILELKSDIATVAIADIICNLHNKCNIKNSTLEDDIEALICLCTPDVINQQALDALQVEVFSREKRILPLLYWFALNISQDSVLNLTTIEPEKNYTETSNWYFWPLIAAAKYDYIMPNVIMFLVRCNYEEWYNVFIMAYLIFKKLGVDFLSARQLFLQDVTGFFADIATSSDEEISYFFRFIWNVLFHVPENEKPSLDKLFEEFGNRETAELEETDIAKDIKGKANFRNAKEIKDLIANEKFGTKYTFGALIDNKGKWADEQISSNVFNAFLMINDWKYFYIEAFVIARLVIHDPETATQFIKSLKITKAIASQNVIAFDYIIMQMKAHNVNCPIEQFKSRKALFNYHEYQKIGSTIIPDEMEGKTVKVIESLVEKNAFVNNLMENNKDINIELKTAECSLLTAIRKQQLMQDESKNNWEREWNYLTAETAPWQKSIPYTNSSERVPITSSNFSMIQTVAMKKKKVIKKHQSQSLLGFAPPVFVTQIPVEPGSFQTDVIIYSIKYTYKATFILSSDRITISGTEGVKHDIALDDIRYVMQRKINHHPIAIEILTYNGESCLISFLNIKTSEMITKINSKKFIRSIGNPLKVTADWVNRRLSNYEYILLINLFAGRSYNNPSMYPVFPWVIDDYTSDTIDLNDPKTYRDLSNPICKIRETGRIFNRSMLTPEDVYLYLSKIEPFSFLLKKNSGKGVEFKSVEEEYQKSKEIMREVIPEFYSFPEIFEGVQLPPWAKTTTEFVQIQRKALESEYVSMHLNDWFDMVFGIRQKDPDSDFPNVFPDSLYESAWNDYDLIEDDRRLIIENDKTVLGQIPSQVFKKKHQKKIPLTSTKSTKVNRTTTLRSNFNPMAAHICESENEVVIKLINDHGTTMDMTITLNNDKTVSNKCSEPQELGIDDRTFDNAFILNDNEKILVDNHPYIIENGTLKKILMEKVQCMTRSQNYVLFVTDDMVINIFNFKSLKEPFKSLPYYRSKATCACISEEFHEIAVASNNGEIVLNSMGNTDYTRLIRLNNCSPKCILITPSTGYVVVHATEMIGPRSHSFVTMATLNGTIISKVEVFTGFFTMKCFKAGNGTEYIIGAGKNGNLYISTTSQLKFNVISSVPSNINHIFYSYEFDSLIVVTSNGYISLLPTVLG